MAEACGVAAGMVTLVLSFKLFFRDLSAFGDALRFWFTPDVISMFRGEWGEDFFAELKLGLWLFLGGLVGTGVYAVVADQLSSS